MTTEQNTTATTKHEAPAVAAEREQSGPQGPRRETEKTMTGIINECPAAAIGRRLAEIDTCLDDYELNGREAGSGFAKTAYNNALGHAQDAHSQLAFALSHAKATSPDGAAVQVAAIMSMLCKLEQTEHKWEREECSRAIDRLVHSALSVLMDRLDADWVTSGVECFAYSIYNPWVEPHIRIKANQEADELEREQRQARSKKAA